MKILNVSAEKRRPESVGEQQKIISTWERRISLTLTKKKLNTSKKKKISAENRRSESVGEQQKKQWLLKKEEEKIIA